MKLLQRLKGLGTALKMLVSSSLAVQAASIVRVLLASYRIYPENYLKEAYWLIPDNIRLYASREELEKLLVAGDDFLKALKAALKKN